MERRALMLHEVNKCRSCFRREFRCAGQVSCIRGLHTTRCPIPLGSGLTVFRIGCEPGPAPFLGQQVVQRKLSLQVPTRIRKKMAEMPLRMRNERSNRESACSVIASTRCNGTYGTVGLGGVRTCCVSELRWRRLLIKNEHVG